MSFLSRLAALVRCPGCLKRADAETAWTDSDATRLFNPPKQVTIEFPSDPLNPRKGEWFVCPNGHRVAQAIEDINEGDMGYAVKIGNWQIREPQVGDAAFCDHCGESYIMPRNYGWMLITEGHWKRYGWRT